MGGGRSKCSPVIAGIGSEEEDMSSLASTVRQRREEIKKRKLEEAEEKIRRDAEKEKEHKFR